MFAHRHSDSKEQFDRVLAAMRSSDAVLALGRDGHGNERFTTVSMLSAEEALTRSAAALAASSHRVGRGEVELAVHAAAGRGMVLGREQRQALEHVTRQPGLSLVVGYAGAGKSAMLGVAREVWEASGYTVRGAALSGIAAENLEGGSGIGSRTIASLEHGWARDRDRLTSHDVLVVDEAGMIGTRQLQRVFAEAEGAGAKVVMVGDVQQLQAIEAGAAFRLLAERHGAAEIGEVRRQHEAWMRDATRAFATGRTGEALASYSQAGMIHAADTRDTARVALIEQWNAERQADPAASRIILTHMNKEVEMLNQAARAKLAERGELGRGVTIQTERGERQFADHDRILFLKNERELGVKNGTLATIEKAATDSMAVQLDDGRRISVDLKSYAHVDHGYAATVHKTQGMTVDRTHVLATPGLDAHATYVAMSRHREGTALHYGRDDFADERQLQRTLARERPKEMALDYEPRSAETSVAPPAWTGRSEPPVTGAKAASNGREEGRGFVGALRRALGLVRPESQPKAAPTAEPNRDPATTNRSSKEGSQNAESGRSTGTAKSQSDQRSPGSLADSDYAKEMRAMIAARVNAPKPTAESMRAAVAAAKHAPSREHSRDNDYGAER